MAFLRSMLLLGAVLGSFLLVATPSGVNADGYENDDDHSNEQTNDDDGCTASVFFVAQHESTSERGTELSEVHFRGQSFNSGCGGYLQYIEIKVSSVKHSGSVQLSLGDGPLDDWRSASHYGKVNVHIAEPGYYRFEWADYFKPQIEPNKLLSFELRFVSITGAIGLDYARNDNYKDGELFLGDVVSGTVQHAPSADLVFTAEFAKERSPTATPPQPPPSPPPPSPDDNEDEHDGIDVDSPENMNGMTHFAPGNLNTALSGYDISVYDFRNRHFTFAGIDDRCFCLLSSTMLEIHGCVHHNTYDSDKRRLMWNTMGFVTSDGHSAVIHAGGEDIDELPAFEVDRENVSVPQYGDDHANTVSGQIGADVTYTWRLATREDAFSQWPSDVNGDWTQHPRRFFDFAVQLRSNYPLCSRTNHCLEGILGNSLYDDRSLSYLYAHTFPAYFFVSCPTDTYSHGKLQLSAEAPGCGANDGDHDGEGDDDNSVYQ